MKKTLAILLALLAAASITLVSCQNDDRKPVDDDDWDNDNDYVDTSNDTNNDSTDTSTDTNNTQTPDGNDNENNNNNNNTNPSGWVEKNDTVYAGVSLALRSESSSNSTMLTSIPVGAAISRLETNYTWDKVTYNGQTGYVMSTYVTVNGLDFEFNECEATAITLSETTNNAVLFYQTPFSPGKYENFELDATNVLLASGVKSTNLSEGYTLNKVGVSKSGNWVKVELTGTVTISTNSTKTCTSETYYIRALAFNRKDVVDSTWNSGSVGGDSGNIFG
ncbi:MAG: SH3 domain-containing protein [Clostridia bacterium]|nr:SH3 domain-containing protein [Clostridia bacterium]